MVDFEGMQDNPRWKEIIEISYLEHMKNQYSEAIDIAKELEQNLGKEQARRIIGELYLRKFKEWAEALTKKYPIKNLDDFAEMERQEFIGSRSHMVEAGVPSSTSYREYVTSCIFAKVCRDLDAAELGYVMFCATDFPLAEVFHPKLRLERSKTLMQGDDCCDFHYRWTESS